MCLYLAHGKVIWFFGPAMTQQHFDAALLVIQAPNCMQIAHNCYAPPTFKFIENPSQPPHHRVRIQLAGSNTT